MELKSYQIPESYKSYLETFEIDPETAISRLENRIEKRNAGAVGYFFLAWLSLKNNDTEKALEAAWQAKTRAPGSPLMERLHYFVSHPHLFDAWKPEKAKTGIKRSAREYERTHPINDLDALITRLSSLESARIKPDFSPGDSSKQPDLSEKSADVDDIVTETLAVIHEKQKNYPAAIETYRKLQKTNSTRKSHYGKQIRRLRRLLGEDSNDS